MNDLQRAIVTRVISDAVDDRYEIDVFNGRETTLRHSRDEREIFAALESTAEDQLRYSRYGKRVGFVRLVYANDGWDVASEFTPALASVMIGARHVAEGVFSRTTGEAADDRGDVATTAPGRLTRLWPTIARFGQP